MTDFHLAAVPVGKASVEELEQALLRAAKVLHRSIELRDPLPVPRGTEDVERGQHRAAALLDRLGAEVLKLRPGRLVGGEPDLRTPLKAQGYLFVTDVDLFTARTEGVVAALLSAKHVAIVSVRRLREAFYRRRADPERQRARLTKELLRMAGRLRGLPECASPGCALAPSRTIPDIDAKEERFCRGCEQRFFEGTVPI